MSDAIRKYQARPTVYRGIRMRSRTEARVAEVLDAAGTPWAYEGDCYAGRGGQYLPDFVVGEPGDTPLVIEVKPVYEWGAEALDKMTVVWETDPTAALVLVATDSPYSTAIELREGVPFIYVFGFIRCVCGSVSFLTAQPDEGGDPEWTCPECGASDGLEVVFDPESTVDEFHASLAGMSLLRHVELSLVTTTLSVMIGGE